MSLHRNNLQTKKIYKQIYRKLILGGIDIHFYSLLSSTYKIGKIHKFLYRF